MNTDSKKAETEQCTIPSVMCSAEWDTDLENIGLPSNMHFSFGSEFGDIVYRLQKTKNVRWCVFSVDRNYYVIEQQLVNGEWVENWTKQMNKSRDEAKAYAENELTKHGFYTLLPCRCFLIKGSDVQRLLLINFRAMHSNSLI